jgi:hypothetical protein
MDRDVASSTRGDRQTWLFWGGLLAALLVGGWLRWPGIRAAYPYLAYVDEGHLLQPVRETLATGRWDPAANAYPELPVQIIAKAATLLSPFAGQLAIAPPLDQVLPGMSYYDRVEPPELILLARSISWLLSLGIITLAALLGRRLGGAEAGVVAAWAAALVPALVMRGATAMVDIHATFFATAALVAVPAEAGRRWLGRAFLAGACGGLAVISKYPAAAVLPALALAIALLPATSGARKLRGLALAGAGSALAVATLMPSTWLQPGAVLRRIRWHTSIYSEKVTQTLLDQALERQEFDLPQIGTPELGYLFVAGAGAGFALLLARRKTRALGVAGLVFVALLVALTARYSFQVFRNVLPAVPLACAAVGVAAASLGQRLGHPRATAAVALAGLLALFLPAGLASARERSGLVDSRRQAIGWLLENRLGKQRLLVAAEVAIPPREVARLGTETVTVAWPEWRQRLRATRPRFLLTGDLRVDGRPLIPPEDRAWILRRYQVAATFGTSASASGPWAWRGNDLRVWVLRRGGRPAAGPQDTD